MAEITVNFDTKDKTLVVEINGKKMKDVSEVAFFKWSDSAGVEIRSVKREEEDDIIVVTKILADEHGTTTEEHPDTDITKELAKKLFPRKYPRGV